MVEYDLSMLLLFVNDDVVFFILCAVCLDGQECLNSDTDLNFLSHECIMKHLHLMHQLYHLHTAIFAFSKLGIISHY